MKAHDAAALRRALLAWHRRHGQPAPWRESGDPYRVMVAAVMAQQTQMARVLPKYEEFVHAYPHVRALARAPTGDVLRAWAPLGYNMRALRLQRAAQLVVERGGFPRTAAGLEQIDGIGPCTAAIIASFAFGDPVPAIDTNVRRIICRVLGDVSGELPDGDVHTACERLISRRAPGRWNQAMMDLGALVCTARSPRCGACPVARWCRSRPRLATRVAESSPAYRSRRKQGVFAGSTRYYRGRIVQALRDLPPGASIGLPALLGRLPERNGLDRVRLPGLLDALARDGLIVLERGRMRLP
jgi:A/G-specific adenine glycosylase